MSNADSEFRFAHRIEVRFRDCDAMGHVNNAVYLTYLEQARFAYWRDIIGIVAGRDRLFILARVEIDFRAQARPGDILDVRIRVAEVGRSSFKFEYEIVDTIDGRQIASARSVQVAYDYGAGRTVPLSAEIRRKFELFEGKTFQGPLRISPGTD
jgi:acyl-CoA thioester hydrolase